MPFGSCKCFIRTLLSNSGETCIPLWSFDNKITIVSKLYILLKSFVRLYYQLLNTCTLFLSFSMLFLLLQSQCKCLSLGPHIPLGIFFVPYAPLCFISKPICPFFQNAISLFTWVFSINCLNTTNRSYDKNQRRHQIKESGSQNLAVGECSEGQY